MEQNFGWIEMVVFGTIAFGFGGWQLISVNREIARDKARKDAAAQNSAGDSAARAGHPVGDEQLDGR